MVPRRPPSGVLFARVSVPRPRIALTGALAALAAAAAVANRQGAGPSAPAAVAGLAAALCAAGFLRLEVRHRDGVERLELFGPVLLVAVFAMPSGLAVLAAALAAALLEGLRRVPPPNGAFTVARWSCAAGAGSLTFAALREGFSLAPRNLLALSAAMVAAAVAAGLPLWLAEHRGPWAARGPVARGWGSGAAAGRRARGRRWRWGGRSAWPSTCRSVCCSWRPGSGRHWSRRCSCCRWDWCTGPRACIRRCGPTRAAWPGCSAPPTRSAWRSTPARPCPSS